jgi:hypothetical protein
MRFQAVSHQPMPDRGLAAAESFSDLGDRRALIYQRLQLGLIQSAACGVLLSIDRLHPMLLYPISDCRFVTSEPPADLGERQTSSQEFFQRHTIHAPYCLLWIGRKKRTIVRVTTRAEPA